MMTLVFKICEKRSDKMNDLVEDLKHHFSNIPQMFESTLGNDEVIEILGEADADEVAADIARDEGYVIPSDLSNVPMYRINLVNQSDVDQNIEDFIQFEVPDNLIEDYELAKTDEAKLTPMNHIYMYFTEDAVYRFRLGRDKFDFRFLETPYEFLDTRPFLDIDKFAKDIESAIDITHVQAMLENGDIVSTPEGDRFITKFRESVSQEGLTQEDVNYENIPYVISNLHVSGDLEIFASEMSDRVDSVSYFLENELYDALFREMMFDYDVNVDVENMDDVVYTQDIEQMYQDLYDDHMMYQAIELYDPHEMHLDEGIENQRNNPDSALPDADTLNMPEVREILEYDYIDIQVTASDEDVADAISRELDEDLANDRTYVRQFIIDNLYDVLLDNDFVSYKTVIVSNQEEIEEVVNELDE